MAVRGFLPPWQDSNAQIMLNNFCIITDKLQYIILNANFNLSFQFSKT